MQESMPVSFAKIAVNRARQVLKVRSRSFKPASGSWDTACTTCKHAMWVKGWLDAEATRRHLCPMQRRLMPGEEDVFGTTCDICQPCDGGFVRKGCAGSSCGTCEKCAVGTFKTFVGTIAARALLVKAVLLVR